MDLEPVKPLNSKINAGTSMLAQYLREDMTAKMRRVYKKHREANCRNQRAKMQVSFFQSLTTSTILQVCTIMKSST